ncbi:MAG: 6-carboxytetrahydropterin synthase QueD [Desulfobacterium sp.]|jgi:6-pyruvoyltetrahydropterin/6-carboxytetrahydropterin synthase|nr:6-carboxytetrahydropterin synthase QueD [Desulfobacterium sp.]
MFELKVKTHFAAAHKLAMVGEKCENLHGHNWDVEVYVAGEQLNEAGVLVDFGEIKRSVRKIMKELDHKYLNELAPFAHVQPSSEQIAVYIANQLKPCVAEFDPPVRVSRVSAWESANACATYILP